MPDPDQGTDGLEKIFREYGKPGEPDFHNNIGNVLLGKDDLEGAEKQFRTAISLRPDDVVFHCNLASALARKGDSDGALREYELCLRLSPGDWHTLFNLANLHFRAGRIEEAAARYDEALRLEPERTVARYRLGLACRRLKRWEEAVSHFEKALRLEPDSPHATEALISLGSYFMDQGDFRTAEGRLLEAVGREADSFLGQFCLGELYFKAAAAGDPRESLLEKSLSAARKAVELDPDDEDARSLLKEIQEAIAKA